MTGVVSIGDLPDFGQEQVGDQNPSLRANLVGRTTLPASGPVLFAKVPLTTGQAVTMDSSGKILAAIATSLANSNVLGFVNGAVAALAEVPFFLELAVVPQTLIVGEVYYLSDSVAGQVINVPPSTPGHYIVQVGTAISTNIIWIALGQPILIS